MPDVSAWVLAGGVGLADGSSELRVWDPAHPDTPDLVLAAGGARLSEARTYDAGARTTTVTAQTRAFYLAGGVLWTIDLLGGADHTPRRVSTLADGVGIQAVLPVSADGQEAWVAVSRAQGWALVRSSLGATDAPSLQLADAGWQGELRDDDGSLRYLAVDVPGQGARNLRIYDLTLQIQAEIAGRTGDARWLGLDPATPRQAYLETDGQLRRLNWDAASVQLAPGSLHDFTDTGRPLVAADASRLHFSDGATLWQVSSGAPATQEGTYTAGGLAQLVVAGDWVAAQWHVTLVPNCCTTVEALNRLTGERRVLNSNSNTLLTGGGQGWVLLDDGVVQTLARPADGSVRTLPGRVAATVVSATTHTGRAAELQDVLTCVMPIVGLGYPCQGGLTQQPLDGGATTVLGDLGLVGTWSGGLVAGLPGVMTVRGWDAASASSTAAQDLVQVMPGVAGSLRRVTSRIP